MTFKETETKINDLVTNFNMWLVKHYEDPTCAKEYYINNVVLLAEEEIKTKIEEALINYVNSLDFPHFTFKHLTDDDYQILSNKLKLANEIAATETDYTRARTAILGNYQDYDLTELSEWTSDKTLTQTFTSRKAFNESVSAYKEQLLELTKWESLQATALSLGGYNSNYPLLKINLSYELYNADARVQNLQHEFKGV